jgi:spore coat protein U-like protein
LSALLGAAFAVAVTMPSALAATATGSFQSRITIQAECKVQSATNLDFGTYGVLDVNRDATSTIGVQCTNTTPYNIQLNAGSTAGGTVATRLMVNGGATVAYQMYRDAGRTQNWGITNGTDTVAGTGNGAIQSITVDAGSGAVHGHRDHHRRVLNGSGAP